MLELEENLRVLNSLIEKLNSLRDTLNISSLEKEKEELTKETEKADFWEDKENSNKVFAKLKRVQRKLDSFYEIKQELENLIDMNKMLLDEFDEELSKDIIKQTTSLSKKLEKLELETLLSGKYDINNAIITLHPGAGGTESQDWVQMLYRMYRKMDCF